MNFLIYLLTYLLKLYSYSTACAKHYQEVCNASEEVLFALIKSFANFVVWY